MADAPTVLHGDSREVLKSFADNTFDSVVCDPPYALVSITKRFANANPETELFAASNPTSVYRRASSGFMGQKWDTGHTAFDPLFWIEVMRVMRPGAHLIAFGGTRSYHRLACAVEDAGFEIRDMLQWLYGSGFPKSHDVSKGIDRAAGAVREVVGIRSYAREGTTPVTRKATSIYDQGGGENVGQNSNLLTAPATDAAREWQGWGTALKPACEPIVLARKPLSAKTVAANVLAHGTGALNIDGCRIEAGDQAALAANWDRAAMTDIRGGNLMNGKPGALPMTSTGSDLGRWPANVLHDGSEDVVEEFPDSEGQQGDVRGDEPSGVTDEIYGKFKGRTPFVRRELKRNPKPDRNDGYGMDKGGAPPSGLSFGDDGSAARFFYTAKADSDDRLGSKHPTVKPVDLMQWLVRLITPKGGTVLDPFAGTGTTGEAAYREGMNSVLIEREERFVVDIERRVLLLGASERERRTAIIKAKGETGEAGPLFAWEPPA